MLKRRPHPELREGEIFLGNFSFYGRAQRDWDDLRWKTKRKGEIAYDDQGRPLSETTSRTEIYPVFVQEAELAEAGVKIE